MKRQLRASIKKAGGVEAFAASIGRSPSTLKKWLRQGVPKASRHLVPGGAAQGAEGPALPRVKLRDLKRDVKLAGGPRKYAALVQRSAGTVRRWLREGAPKSGFSLMAILEVQSHVKEHIKRSDEWEKNRAKDLKRLLYLRKQAEKQEPRLKLPSYNKQRPIEGRVMSGQAFIKHVNEELSEHVIAEFCKWVRTRRGNAPYWSAFMRFSQYSRDEKMAEPRSGKSVEVQILHAEDANMFMAEQDVPTPRFSELTKLVKYIKDELTDMWAVNQDADFFNEFATIIYFHTGEVFNYRTRTAEEIRARESAYRKVNRDKKKAKDIALKKKARRASIERPESLTGKKASKRKVRR